MDKILTEISTIAAHLAHGPKALSSFAEDMPKTTPKSVLRMIEDEEERQRQLAIRLAEVGKLLRSIKKN